MENAGVKPDVTAGLSLGEYAAIAAAGGMSDQDAIRLSQKERNTDAEYGAGGRRSHVCSAGAGCAED